MTKIIGLTGGIGSGKTMVAKYIESLGYPVYIADDEAKKLMDTPQVILEVVSVFGNDVLADGKISREKLAAIVFNNPDKLQKLNRIIHPKVKEHFDNWVRENKIFPLVFKEAAILFETGGDKYCDAVITVTAPIDTRLQRVMERDKTDKEAVLKRMNSQWADEQRVAKSDFVIQNISVNETYKQIKQILNLLINQ
ncbi:MAG: dephospho-CoA kinase [Flavobacterium sp.]